MVGRKEKTGVDIWWRARGEWSEACLLGVQNEQAFFFVLALRRRGS